MNASSASNVHFDWPVTASSAKSFEPECRYITPSMTSGVALDTFSRPGISNTHFTPRRPTFEVLISSSGEKRLFRRSRLCIGQSVRPGVDAGFDPAVDRPL